MTSLFTRMNMASKLFVSPVVCLLFMILSGAVSFWGMRAQQATIQEMHSVRLANFAKVSNIMDDTDAVHTNLYRLITRTTANFDKQKLGAETKATQETLGQITTAIKGISVDTALKADERKFAAELLTIYTAYSKDATDMLDMLESDVNAATMYMQQADDKYTTLENKFKQLMKLEASLNDASHEKSISTSHEVLLILGGVLIFSILATIVLSCLINRIIMLSIRSTVEVIESMADGDLTKRITISSSDEIGNMARHMNEFIDSLQGTIHAFAKNATELTSASEALNNTSERIATGAEEVAAQAATVATAGEEMSATSGDIAQSCQMAAEGAQRAAQTAGTGAGVVENTVAVMGQIAEKVMESARTVEKLGERSDQIGAIIGTIEDIADQTNLLALNAAIEAARAGEQGRGFAVVADEVRALAERTTRATKEIGEMIKAIQRETKGAVAAMEQGVQQVESGTLEAAKSGQALQEILEQVNDVAMQVHQIATAAEEQTATTSEISSNMLQITHVVQQTAQGAHESATAAAQLNGNAEELQQLVRKFRL